jgi:DNA-binding MarR family transcriptional regulator
MPAFRRRSPWPREALHFTAALERAGRSLITARRGLGASFGLTVTEWRLLKAIGRKPGQVSVAELGRRTGMTRQNAHRAASELQRAGWLRLAPQPGDRRVRIVCLTAAGERWLASLDSCTRDVLLEMTNDIPPQELELMSDILIRISAWLQSCRSIVEAARRQRRRQPCRRKLVIFDDDSGAR